MQQDNSRQAADGGVVGYMPQVAFKNVPKCRQDETHKGILHVSNAALVKPCLHAVPACMCVFVTLRLHACFMLCLQVNYKNVMKQYGLGPNGGILTASNLFATRFDQVSSCSCCCGSSRDSQRDSSRMRLAGACATASVAPAAVAPACDETGAVPADSRPVSL